ncbi:Lpg1974 family pore-forming outer membrane protein [Legionella brunensis]|uniref:Outer membrane protein n=1 Tax=Legionella brunensis TaxID=29422 RepID=A0A0W0SNV7_9GAMM|nr:Lpg1974 family pore-forming outer membrane protein [Legionella brunensis]KTC84893.1 outer membrane protein [Legionella brunensis]
MKLSKKIIITAALTLGSSVFAGTMGPVCTPDNVTVPCASTAWDLGIQALYLRPTYSADNRHFAYGGFQDINGTTVYRQLKTDWDWGFKLEASYHFNTGNDINVNWYHWDEDKTYVFSRPSLDGERFLTLHHHVKPKWDAVNAEFGQHVDFGLRKNIRFHGGLQFARLQQREYSPYTEIFPDGSTGTGANRLKFKYSGVGPRIGTDMSYDLTNNFAVYGNAATAILVGDNEVIDTSDVSPNRGSHTSVVPELEAKLGAKYTHLIAKGTLILDGGYMWINYFDTFHMVQENVRGQTDFALNGPYVGIKWIG